MSRNAAFAADCGRLFDTVSTRYQNRVRNLDLQTADATLIPVSKPRPQYSYITDSGLPGGIDDGVGALGRSADRRRPSNWISEAGAPRRVRPPNITAFDRSQCARKARRPEGRSPATDARGCCVYRTTLRHLHRAAQTIEVRASARQRARGAEPLVGASRHADADRTNRHRRRSNQSGAHACTARWWRCFSRRSFRERTGRQPPASSPARPRRTLAAFSPKYLSPPGSHASAMGPVNHRISETENSGLVFSRGAHG